MEEFAANCRFILTCNFIYRIIDTLHSRCAVVDFSINGLDKKDIAGRFYKNILNILKQENVKFDPKVVAELVKYYFPDYRRIINELQRYSVGGEINTGIFAAISSEIYKTVFQLLKAKNFTDLRRWVAENSSVETTKLFHELYKHADQFLLAESIPTLILILADYQYKAAFVADQEINLIACLTEIMGTCKFIGGT
jgi:DNA polymerase III delta prime subunit